jgi:hypothetical protein
MTKGNANIGMIPLAEAVFCEDCTIISRARHATCPSCGGSAILNLVKVIEVLVQREMDRTIQSVWERS